MGVKSHVSHNFSLLITILPTYLASKLLSNADWSDPVGVVHSGVNCSNAGALLLDMGSTCTE